MVYTPIQQFHSEHYHRHNQKRLEHLASLGIDFNGATVLEVGAGIGDHSEFLLTKNCQLTITEARLENLELLRDRFPNYPVLQLDLDEPNLAFDQPFDIIYCYGLLYHLKNPTRAIEFMAQNCRGILLLETCVSPGDEEAINPCSEVTGDPTQSFSGTGCRPTRPWIFQQLKNYFNVVYLPTTQPDHEEFPIDWTIPPSYDPAKNLIRSIFIASRTRLENTLFIDYLPMRQLRYRVN